MIENQGGAATVAAAGCHFVFSIDVEDWFQTENLRDRVPAGEWPARELRVERSTRLVLDILGRHQIRATFFLLGWVAERCPDLVREIAAAGHEIASHGYGHELLHRLSSQEIADDIRRSLELLAPLARTPVVGYRAPSFSINDAAIDCLKELGLRYDASYNRFQFNQRYGSLTPGQELGDGAQRLANGVLEFPVTVNTYLGVHWPLGGGYFRLSPGWFLRRQLRDAARSPVASIYLHPWEFDPAQPRIPGLRPSLAFRHYHGLRQNAGKLEAFIAQVRREPGVVIATFGELAAAAG